mmetsp:Transcript_21946/g.76955  ORF Transcript_21946/g.76955 Transcript_21946/m.76955 type:complete len:240 (-) Transcript_21946:219-938(-)
MSSVVSGISYGWDTPVSSIRPSIACLYSPFTSRRAHSSTEVETYTSRKPPPASETSWRACSRAFSKGAMGTAMAMPRWRTTSPATHPMRATFVLRSSMEKPSPLDRCVRTTSPSSTVILCAGSISVSFCSRPWLMVVLPLPLRPVKKIVKPRLRSGGFTCDRILITSGSENQAGMSSPAFIMARNLVPEMDMVSTSSATVSAGRYLSIDGRYTSFLNGTTLMPILSRTLSTSSCASYAP